MRWIPIFLVIWLVGCPTDYPSTDGKAVATHPWELPSSEYPILEPAEGWGNKPGHPQVPNNPQPPRPTEDFDSALLPGSWLQIAISNPDGVLRRPIESMHRIDFTPNGKLVYHLVNEGEDRATSGTWEKTGPEMILFTLGENSSTPFTFQMYEDNFFFFVNSNPPQGYWFARIQEAFSQTIMANRFQTNLGEMHLADVVGNSFSGTVNGSTLMEFTGVYHLGVLLLDWVEPDSGNRGLAALRVSEDWSRFDGVWWINNFEAAPFGGKWTGTASLPEGQPEV